ncbi:MAG: DNA recombination protein RmuC, partial [Pseudomonadota bacterium]
MELDVDLISVLVGLGAGLAAGGLVAYAAASRWKARHGELERHAEAVTVERDKLDVETDSLKTNISQLEARNAKLGAEAEAQQKAFDMAQRNMTSTFEALAGKALKGSTDEFLKVAEQRFKQLQSEGGNDLDKRQEAIAALVKPVQENLSQMREQLTQLEKEREGAYQSLRQQVTAMGEQHQVLRDETRKLTTALRAPKARGAWGELQLKRVVEMAGMLSHVDFHEQTSMETEAGRQQPDMVIRLPGGQRIAVDAKVPLEAFLNAAEHSEEATRESYYAAHANAVAKHVKDLGKKAYWNALDFSPEFVVMFVPGEHYFSIALDHKPELIAEGMEQQVIIATPTTLLALLRAVHFGWRQEQLAESAREIAAQGKVLYDRLGTMAGHVNKVG